MVYVKWILAIVLLLSTLAGMLYFLTMDNSDHSADELTSFRSPIRIQSSTVRSFPSTGYEDYSRKEHYDDGADRDGSISGRLAIFVQTEEPTQETHLSDDWFELDDKYEDEDRRFATSELPLSITDQSSNQQYVSKNDLPNSTNFPPIIVEPYQSTDNTDPEPTSRKSTRLFPANYPFTSGHQNSFGIPIEDDEHLMRILNMIRNHSDHSFSSTTAANVHSVTRVSPTLPNFNRPTNSHNLRPTQEGKSFIII